MPTLSVSTCQCVALAGALVAGCAAEPALPEALPTPPVRAETGSRLEAALDAWAEAPGHRGISAAVVFADGDVWRGAAGEAGPGEPLRPDHLIWIASITKTFTAALVHKLVEEGTLALDDPLSRWLEPIEHVEPSITLRQLLNHTSGVHNYTRSRRLRSALEADASREFRAEELLGFLEEPAFAPGEGTQYTNTAFLLLGRVVRAATGREVVELYRERLWEPLGLERIFLPGIGEPPGPVAGAWAGPEAATPVQPLEERSTITLGQSAFGLFADAETVARWGDALFRGDVLRPETRELATAMIPDPGLVPQEAGIGLGIRGYAYLGREQWGHSGACPYGQSLLVHEPTSGVTVAVLMNQGRGADHWTFVETLLGIALEE